MKNYTTQTASLKATTIDTRLLDAHKIDTKKLFINGELFDPSKIEGKYYSIVWKMTIGNAITSKSNGYNVIDLNQDGKLFVELSNENNTGDEVFHNWFISRIFINGYEILPNLLNESQNGYGKYYRLWEDGDDWNEIYGGITNDSTLVIHMTVSKQCGPATDTFYN